ncbi:hypothetical protein ALC57_02611 [Trachymyrmex cornetzi]|uniref:Helix-turn-helix domain-containing protein n=1 Tax=Trachymyrmex cornetzi TaxID=471704 RepID=A0A151JNB4_9HYME|nr:hypothetical protein ALC57_02611 [Trachymyrmex cornetzi]
MEMLIASVETEAASVGLRFNPAKCATLHVGAGNGSRVLPTSFQIQGETINLPAQGDLYTHLGIPTGFSVLIINNNNTSEYDWYHKPTFSGRYLNFLSQHPLSQKKGTIMDMVDRAFLLSAPKYHRKNLIFVIETLLMNDYPLDFIFKTINERLKSLLYKKTLKQSNDNSSDIRLDEKV